MDFNVQDLIDSLKISSQEAMVVFESGDTSVFRDFTASPEEMLSAALTNAEANAARELPVEDRSLDILRGLEFRAEYERHYDAQHASAYIGTEKSHSTTLLESLCRSKLSVSYKLSLQTLTFRQLNKGNFCS